MIDVHIAMERTILLAELQGMWRKRPRTLGLSYEHLLQMRFEMDSMTDREKLNRWLGWAQCAVVAAGCASLEDMKKLNSVDCHDR